MSSSRNATKVIAGSSDKCCRTKAPCCSKLDRSNNGIYAPEEDEAWPIGGVAMGTDAAAFATGIGKAVLRAASRAFIGAALK